MTYSIVARDPRTGDLGVAVQTCMFAVGSIVPYAQNGIGAVATQAFSEPAYGPRCLEAMANGMSASDALAQARALDPGEALRQVGVVDVDGNAAAFTGDLCVDFAGHYVGDGYAVQANMMASERVWPAMAEAYEHAKGDFADRLLAALAAGEREGGDARGRMSAAMRVAGEIAIDLRVDDHAEPVEELTRLSRVATAFRGFSRSTEALFGGDPEEALRQIDAALALCPDDENLRFMRSGALVFSGRVEEAAAIVRELVSARPSWATVIRSFASKGLMPLPDGVDAESFIP
jgi:uncharacterized Ntn-hydrolase superfamily protein